MSPNRNTPNFGFGTSAGTSAVDQKPEFNPYETPDNIVPTRPGLSGGDPYYNSPVPSKPIKMPPPPPQVANPFDNFYNAAVNRQPEVANPFDNFYNAAVNRQPEVEFDPIASLYGSVLGRDADAGGLAYWTNAYNTGMPMADIQQSFMNSPEYLNRQNQIVTPLPPSLLPPSLPQVNNPYETPDNIVPTRPGLSGGDPYYNSPVPSKPIKMPPPPPQPSFQPRVPNVNTEPKNPLYPFGNTGGPRTLPFTNQPSNPLRPNIPSYETGVGRVFPGGIGGGMSQPGFSGNPNGSPTPQNRPNPFLGGLNSLLKRKFRR